VTTINGGQTFASCGTGDTCIYKDLISGLFVTGILASGGNTTNTTTPATYHWAAALQACATSTYGGYPAGSWRLPTQKETIALYVNGLASIASTNFNIFTSYTWTASTGASTGNGFVFSISIQAYSSKSNLFNAFCVK